MLLHLPEIVLYREILSQSSGSEIGCVFRKHCCLLEGPTKMNNKIRSVTTWIDGVTLQNNNT